MPLNIPVGFGVASLEFNMPGDAENMFCTIGFKPVAGPTSDAHAQRVAVAWQTNCLARMSNQVRLVGATLRTRQDGGSDTVNSYYFSAPVSGTLAEPAMPPNCAILLEKLTGLGGRRYTGRMFVPGATESDDDSIGRLATSRTGAWTTAANAFRTACAAAGSGSGATRQDPVDLYLFHGNATTRSRTSSGGTTTITISTGAAGPDPTPITGFRCDPLIATQRRRLR